MKRVLLNIGLTTLFVSIYAHWVSKVVDQQIDKMQEDAFNTPGAEAPIPLEVATSGALIIGVHLLLGRQLFQLKLWQSIIGLICATFLGSAIFFWRKAG